MRKAALYLIHTSSAAGTRMAATVNMPAQVEAKERERELAHGGLHQLARCVKPEENVPELLQLLENRCISVIIE